MTAEPQHYDDVLPNPGVEITPGNTAVVITDPQVDFLSEDGVTWHIVWPSVEKMGLLPISRNCLKLHTQPAPRSSCHPITTTRPTMAGNVRVPLKR